MAGCQHDIVTPFTTGLAELEPDIVPEPTGPYTETLVTDVETPDYIHVYGRGFILADLTDVWPTTMDPEALVAKCTTTDQTVVDDNEPDFEFSFIAKYEVDDLLTVKWQDAWRFGVLDGDDDAPERAMIKHQKIEGSSFIKKSEGTIELTPSLDDPDVTEYAVVEHLNSVGGSSDTVLKGVQHTYDSLVAVAHGQPIPPCP
ncbi:MAG TPA: hypothetical protein VGM88_23615 [Kofleriaceae bacterium]